ncbi:MAG TPA: hypothetical protein VKX46_09205 [Ktedonobacteraceae bacterium]|nr:hypothetical protein [Ktedonobacteraceae bacterium]
MVKRNGTRLLVSILCMTLFGSLVSGFFVTKAYAADNFNHSRIPLRTMYPSQDSLMTTLTAEKTSCLAGQHANGNFESTTNTKYTDGDWGCVALLAYWWYQNGQNNDTVANAARSGVDFALANRNWTSDPADTRYLLVTNSGESYTAYNLANSDAFSNYPTTAFTLINKAMMLRYGQGLFTQDELNTITDQAYSNWRWLTRVSVFDPQSTSNQVIAAIVGGYMLGLATNDQNLQNEVLSYYSTGVAGSNNTSGYRNTNRVTLQGFPIFAEHNGFDSHYSGLQTTYMAALHALMGYDTSSDVYNDLIQQASYMNNRLSEAGSMHGGTRHNEISGSRTDIAGGLGYNFMSAVLGADMGRVKILTGPVSTSAANSDLYGHRAHPLILFHEFFSTWNDTVQTKNEAMALRQGSASIYFDGNRLPQEISVNGTTFTDIMVNNGQEAQSFYYQDAQGSWTSDVSTSDDAFDSTSNYQIRTVTGSANGGNLSIKSRYITNGSTLYHITLIQANTTVTLQNEQVMLGLPNVSTTQRIVKIYDADNANNYLDLSGDSGSLSAARFTTGDVDIAGWPQLEADNVSTQYGWMTSSNYNLTLEDLVNQSPRIYWYPSSSSSSAYITATDTMEVPIHANPAGDTLQAGDVLCAVAKFSPHGSTEGFTVNPTYKPDSSFIVTSMEITDNGMDFSFDFNGGTFTDTNTGEVVSFN